MNQQRITEIADCLYEQGYFPKMKRIYNKFIRAKENTSFLGNYLATVLYLNFVNVSKTELKEKAIEIIKKEKIKWIQKQHI